VTLVYGSPGFATRAKQLIATHTPFSVVVKGQAASELGGRITDGLLVEPARMTASRHLRLLVAVVMLASAQGASYRIRHAGRELVVAVFWGSEQEQRA